MKKFWMIAVFLVLLLLIPFHMQDLFQKVVALTSTHSATPTKQPTPPTTTPLPTSKPAEVRIAAVGDVMLHIPQMQAGAKPGGGYDFRPFFKEVQPYLSSADIAIANFETTLAGPSKPYSGYPQFNAPDQLVDAVKYAGIDLVSTANNHAIDTGMAGTIRTYKTLLAKGVEPVGTAPTPQDRHAIFIEKNGIKFAFLAYTEQTNGLPVPQPYLINRIDSKQVAKDIAEARAQGADFVSVSFHFGVEYQREPNAYQTKVAHQALLDGADVVLGSHPHVLEPMEELTVNGKKKFIIYSMGNFISNQTDPYTDEGVILFLDVVKDPVTKETTLKDVSYIPTFVDKYQKNGKRGYIIIPMKTATPESFPTYPGITATKWQSVWAHTTQHLNERGHFSIYAFGAE